ncbi:MAG: glutathione S-transferase family protein [Pseudomonadota bacterium]
MSYTLYDNPTSPYCRKVKMVMHHFGMTDVALVPAAGNAAAPGTMPMSVNPLGKIPCLQRDDGPALYDSRVICAYLNDLHRGDLYGTGAQTWDIMTLEATADGILDAALTIVYEARVRPPEMIYEPWTSGQADKINRALDALEARWIAMLQGPLNLGQIAVGSALGYLDLRGPVGEWRTDCPHLSAWFAEFAQTEMMLATPPN